MPNNAARVFIAMSAAYGRQWESQYGMPGGVTFKLWEKELGSLTSDQIDLGLNNTKIRAEYLTSKGQSSFPPNLFEFTALCKKKAKHPSHQLFIGSDFDHAKQARGVTKLQKMRETLLV